MYSYYTENEVLDFVNEEDVKFIRLAFFDLSGKQKNISIMANQLERAFRDGISFDASAITGFESPNKSDLFLHPDPSTLSIIPWRPNTGKVIRLFCNITYPDGTPYEKDCRNLLQKVIKEAKKEYNLQMNIGSEIEFYLFKLDENGEPTKTPFDKAGYMDIAPEDKGENIRREICFTLEQMGISPESSHHEEGPGQNEIDFHYSNPLTAADNTATFKWVVRTKAAGNGLYADFSAKPLPSQAGSGMHINLSCSDSSKTPQIIAGILKHIAEITYFLNPTESSYDRLGECKAPKYISWGYENRSTLIRLPAASKDAQRIEIRSADPNCNPYISIALLLYAALDGIKNNLQPPAPVEENLFDNSQIDEIIKKYDLQSLPDTLDMAKEIAENSPFVRGILL
ncbi:MAG: glutamine synthetase family protein [Treponema sp.]|nr:glutamine synthetase family protein [Treponema sp.]